MQKDSVHKHVDHRYDENTYDEKKTTYRALTLSLAQSFSK